jgi:AraC-like DNA-binding protein
VPAGVVLGEPPWSSAGFALNVRPWRRMARSHWHPCLEITYVRSGTGRFCIGPWVFRLEPDAVFVIPPGVPHQTVDDGPGHWNLSLYLRPESVVVLGEGAERRVREVMRRPGKRLAGEARADWHRVLGQLAAEASRPGTPDRWTVALRLLEACLLVDRSLPAEALPVPGPPPTARRYVDEVVAFVEEHLAERLDLARVAQHVGLHPRYLGGLFRRATGWTLREFVQRRRLDRARELLLCTDLPIGEVWRRTGFESATTFYRRFRLRFGVPPRRLR